jgi:segregation and condensation protein A
MSTTPFKINLPQFEGPFDLLLFFIERDELDIYDIPIAKITDNFLEHIQHMTMLNIEMASEFILVASTLMRIKSRLLLPRKELNEAGEEIDPREELVQKLLEYKKYKEVSEQLSTLEDIRLQMMKRGNSQEESKNISAMFETDSEMETLSMYKLLKVFETVLKRHEISKNRVVHEIAPYPYQISDEKEIIINALESKEKLDFIQAFDTCESRIHAVFHFLAILELIQEQVIEIIIGEGVNNFWIQKVAPNEDDALSSHIEIEQ